jgi:hypothetical protein
VISKPETKKLQNKPLGVYLVEAGIITSDQVNIALNEQKLSGRLLGEILANRGWVEQQTIEFLMAKVVLPEQRVLEKKLSDREKNGSHNPTSWEQASQAEQESSSLMSLAVASRELKIQIFPRRTSQFLLLVVLTLVLASLVGKFTQYFLPDYFMRDFLAELFNVDSEQNIPALYSWSVLLLCSILLATIAHAKKVAGESYVRHWASLSIIFLFLSLDEAVSLHEYLSGPMKSALNTSGFLTFAWVIPFAIFVIVCFLAFLRFLTALPAKTRRLFLLAGSIYVGGAMGMELVGGYYADLYGKQNMMYAMMATIEEFFEMLGIVVFIYALLSYMSSYMKGVSLRINFIDDRKQRRSALAK